jgi:hypothetical protein
MPRFFMSALLPTTSLRLRCGTTTTNIVEELIALVTDHAVARAAFAERFSRRPGRSLSLRRKLRVLADIVPRLKELGLSPDAEKKLSTSSTADRLEINFTARCKSAAAAARAGDLSCIEGGLVRAFLFGQKFGEPISLKQESFQYSPRSTSTGLPSPLA